MIWRVILVVMPETPALPDGAIPFARTGDDQSDAPQSVENRNQPVIPSQDVGFAVVVTPGPDGKPWGALTISTPPLSSFTLMLPPKPLKSLSESLPAILRELAEEVERQRLGLILPTNTLNLKGN